MIAQASRQDRDKPDLVAIGAILDLDAAELAIIYPRLAGVIERDRGGDDSGRYSGGFEPRLPVNHDVERAIAQLDSEIPTAAIDVRLTLASKVVQIGPPTTLQHIRSMPSLYAQLVAKRDDKTAVWLAARVAYWTKVARQAIRLEERPRPIGFDCPYHRDEPSALLLLGWTGRLRLDKKSADDPITWRFDDTVECRSCKSRWTKQQYRLLGRLLVDEIKMSSGGLADTESCALVTGVAAGTIRSWASQGILQRKGTDDRGRTLYTVTDVERLARPSAGATNPEGNDMADMDHSEIMQKLDALEAKLDQVLAALAADSPDE